MVTVRRIISLAVVNNWPLFKLDVNNAFLYDDLVEDVYMTLPDGYNNEDKSKVIIMRIKRELVGKDLGRKNYSRKKKDQAHQPEGRWCELKRSIYGLKQASRQWNTRFDDEIKKFGFTQNHDEPCVYQKASGSYVAILILYVDDVLLMGNNISMLQDVKSYLGRSFAMKYLGDAAYILGIKIYRDRSKRLIGLCQSAYIEKILKRYYMENSKRGTIPMQEKLKLSKSQGASTHAKKQRMQNVPYASAIGSIMYAVRYADDLRSQTGYVFVLNRGVVNWKNTKQSIFATSSTDAEYIVAFDALKEAVWIHKFINP
ncbi:retrotransposon protein, putative, ty1-copia subclass [Tanacetum coccineum]